VYGGAAAEICLAAGVEDVHVRADGLALRPPALRRERDARLHLVGEVELHGQAAGVVGDHHPVVFREPSRGRISAPGWQGPDIRDRLTAALGTSVEIENDVNLVALAEYAAGASIGTMTSVLLWSGSGIGAAVLIDGRLHRGATGSAGEVGYIPVPGQPLRAASGRPSAGGFDRSCSAAAIRELGRSLGLRGTDPIRMVRSATTGGAGEFLDALATRYATGLTAIIAVIDPEVVILAGPILHAGGELLRARIAHQVAELGMRPVPIQLGLMVDEPVLTGSCRVALSALREAIFANPTRPALPSRPHG